MSNIGTIYLFFFIFSVLFNTRILFKFLLSVLQTPPKKLEIDKKELLTIGITLSYILTYIIQN
jgi:hypothetical protein